MQRLSNLGRSVDVLKQSKIITIGEATTAYLETFGLSVAFFPSRYDSQHLVQELTPKIAKPSHFLIPQSAQGNLFVQENLLQLQHKVDRVIVYQNKIDEQARDALTRLCNKKNLSGWMILTSPSAAKALTQITLPKQLKIAAIGQSTLAQLRKNNLHVSLIPKKSTFEDLYSQIISQEK